MSWDVVARALFVDNGAAAGLAKFNASIHDVVKAAPGGTRAFYTMERGLSSLALEAAGVTGPLGRVAEGLLKFGGGTTLVLGAAAGIGVIATAYRLSAEEAEKLAAAHEKLVATYDRLLTAGKPQLAAMAEARDIVAATRAEYEKLSATVPSPGGPKSRGSPGEVAQAQENLNAALRNLGVLRQQEAQAQNVRLSAAAAGGTKWAQAFVESIKNFDIPTQLRVLALGGAQYQQKFGAMGVEAGKIWGEAWLQAAQAKLDQDIAAGRLGALGRPLTAAQDLRLREGAVGGVEGAIPKRIQEKFPPREYFIQDLEKAIVKAKPDKPDAGRLAAEALALLGALKQGGVGGALAAGGGLVSELSSLKGLGGLGPVGIITTALGGLFQLFDHSAERRQREQNALLTRIVENTSKRGQPDHISVVVSVNGKELTGAILDDVIYGIRRRERTNAVPVLPPAGG